MRCAVLCGAACLLCAVQWRAVPLCCIDGGKLQALLVELQCPAMPVLPCLPVVPPFHCFAAPSALCREDTRFSFVDTYPTLTSFFLVNATISVQGGHALLIR